MERISISQVVTRLVAGVLLLGLVTMPSLQAEVQCSTADLKGLYSFGASGLEVVPQAIPPLLPEAGVFPASAVGTFTADGEGKITTFRVIENVNTPAEAVGFFVLDRDPIAEGVVPHIDYTVGSDCHGTITWLDQTPFGIATTTLPFVLANGGREGFAIRPEPPSVLLFSFKRVDDFDQRLESKIDRIMLRLGIPPSVPPIVD